jgi:hypothetical protein
MRPIYRFARWLRMTLPPGWILAFALLVYAIPEIYHRILVAQWGPQPQWDNFDRIREAIVMGALILYAGFRVLAFHPFFRDDYRTWLSFTPWRRGLPLPLGPLPVSGQDLLVVALLLVLMYHADWQLRCGMIAVFLCLIAGLLACSFVFTRQQKSAFIIGYGLAGVVWLGWETPHLALALSLLLFLFARSQLGPSLDQFPWEEWQQKRKAAKSWFNKAFKQQTASQSHFLDLGWPYDYLSPKRQNEMPTPQKLLLIGMVMSWVSACLAGPHGERLAGFVATFLAFGGTGLCVQRVSYYVWSHVSPINLWGRLFTFRWIIPSYDAAFVPLAAFPLTALCLFLFVWDLQMPLIHAIPLSTGVFLYIVFVTSPRLEKWRLTSAAQLKAWALPIHSRDFEQL